MLFRKIVGLGATCAGVSSIIYFGKTIYYADELAKKIELKENNSPVSVPKKVNDLISSVMKDMNLTDDAMALVKSVCVEDIDLGHFGTSFFKPGAYLTVPLNYCSDSEKLTDINVTPIIKSLKLPEDAPELEELKSLLYVPEKVRKFAIANEVYKTRDYLYFTVGLQPLLLVLLFTPTLRSFQTSLKTHPKTLLTFIFSWYFLLSFILYRYMKLVIVFKADAETAKLGPDYIEGALEYFDRIIKRNKIIKKLNNASYHNDDPDGVHMLSFTDFVSVNERIAYYKSQQKDKSQETSLKGPYSKLNFISKYVSL